MEIKKGTYLEKVINRIESDLEEKTGLTKQEIEDMSPTDYRVHLEKITGKKVRISKGNLYPELISFDQIKKELNQVLKQKERKEYWVKFEVNHPKICGFFRYMSSYF